MKSVLIILKALGGCLVPQLITTVVIPTSVGSLSVVCGQKQMQDFCITRQKYITLIQALGYCYHYYYFGI